MVFLLIGNANYHVNPIIYMSFGIKMIYCIHRRRRLSL